MYSSSSPTDAVVTRRISVGTVECQSYDSLTVSYTWELTSVSMRYSQGDGVLTPLSRLVLYPFSVVSRSLR